MDWPLAPKDHGYLKMKKIKVRLRHGIERQTATDCLGMLRGLAVSIDGYGCISGRSNPAMLRKGFLVFCFRDRVAAERFRRSGRQRMSDVFSFHRLLTAAGRSSR